MSLCVRVFVAVCLCVCVPVALWLLPMSENCPLRVIYFKALLGLELKLELGRVSNLNFLFLPLQNIYTVLHNYICHANHWQFVINALQYMYFEQCADINLAAQ